MLTESHTSCFQPADPGLSQDGQTEAIQAFLSTHVIAIQDRQLALFGAGQRSSAEALVLQASEKSGTQTSDQEPAATADTAVSMAEAEKYSLLGQQFSTLVVISTFTASVVVAFLALMHDIHTDGDSDSDSPVFGRVGMYQAGVILGFLSFSANLGIAVLAGANAVVSSYAAASPSGRRQLLRSRAHRLMLCGYIQLLSALSFATSILLLLILVLGKVIAGLSFVIFVLGVTIACWDLAFQRPPSPRLIYESFFTS
ncbi:hypothetical protein HGRIS_011017 [Hohenbuehelia grisea]|uniref:PGG domain-containing protein n=1 Tax=Hohenbuehelia grisea TaxID=104357 RepID=A0ABR3IYU1_9AGAR